MQASQEVRAAGRAGRQAPSGGGAAAATASAELRAEFRDMFVSLVDPAGLLDMEKCIETAGRMRDAAQRAGYGAGERMASALCDIFADTCDIVNRPVDDGALCSTHVAFQNIMPALYDTAWAYKDGRDSEPVGELERIRGLISGLRTDTDALRERLRRADPPGSGLTGLSVYYRGRICRDLVREEQEAIRTRQRARGVDPVFPPPPKSIDEFLGEPCDPNISSAEMLNDYRGKGC